MVVVGASEAASEVAVDIIQVESLPTGVWARPLNIADAGAVTALMAACELLDDGQVEIDEGDIVADWQRPSVDLDVHTVGLFDEAGMLAYADVFTSRRAEVFVHPRARGRGLGSALMRWTWAVAWAGGGRLVGQTVTDNNRDAAQLFASMGYQPLWRSWILTLRGEARPAAPTLPADVEIRAPATAEDERAAFQVIEDAFSEWPDRDPVAYGDWAAGSVHRAGFDPWQLPLAVSGDRVVGVAHLVEYEGVAGWVHQIAVAGDQRGRGIGRALLQHAFGTFWDHGHRTFELSTDSRTGALGLYQHVGMAVRRSYTHWAKELEP